MAKKGGGKKSRKASKPAKKKGRRKRPLLPGLEPFAPDSPLEEAQELVYDAFEEPDPRRRVQLAKEALEVCPDCADAHGLLAEHADNLNEAIAAYRRAVEVGRTALGDDFETLKGHFWMAPQTQPYMRALLGLAQSLRVAGKREEAAELFRELLQLNPEDGQGVRYIFAGFLMELDRDDELRRLLGQYADEETAAWTYAEALLAFRRDGDSPDARGELKKAIACNPHVPPLLLGDVAMPPEQPEFSMPGGEDEAVLCAADLLAGWKMTPGAISWLRKASGIGLPNPAPRPPITLAEAIDDLRELPQEAGELWQIDARRLPGAVEVNGEKVRFWSAIVANCSGGDLPSLDMAEQRPTDSALCELLIRAMLQPAAGKPHRPATIEVSTKKRQKAWRSQLAAIDIDCVYRKPLVEFDEMFGQIGPILMASGAVGSRSEAATGDPSELPQEVTDLWQADILHLPTWIDDVGGEPTRPWIVLVTDAVNDLVLAHDLTTEQPHPDALWEKLAASMWHPMIGDARRPGEVQVRSEDHRNVVGPRLAEIGVRCVVSDRMEQLDTAFESLVQHLTGPSPTPAMVEVPGVEPRQVGAYFEAAAAFFRSAPWRHVAGDVVIQIDCEKFETGRWFALVMGQSGITLGMALYEDPETVRALFSGDWSPEEAGERTSGLSVMFDEEFAMAVGDLEAAEQFGWPVATPEAYPCAMRIDPGRKVRPPTAGELEIIEAALRAVPRFLADAPGHIGPCPVEVNVDSGTLSMTLSRTVI